jgi:hypothetical protein
VTLHVICGKVDPAVPPYTSRCHRQIMCNKAVPRNVYELVTHVCLPLCRLVSHLRHALGVTEAMQPQGPCRRLRSALQYSFAGDQGEGHL